MINTSLGVGETSGNNMMHIRVDKKDKCYWGQHFPTRALSQGDTFDDCVKNIREASALVREHTLKRTISLPRQDRYRQNLDNYPKGLYIKRTY